MNNYILKCAIVAITLMSSALTTLAQDQDDIDYDLIKIRLAQQVAQMNDYVSFMADKKIMLQDRREYKQDAENLFIEDCNAFDEIIQYKDGSKRRITREGVTMQTISLRSKRTTTMLMKDYFERVINFKYQSVTIETTSIDAMYVSKLQPTDDGKYICSVYFDQAFVGRRADGGVYKDMTRKWVVCHVEVQTMLDGTNEYIVELGDVFVDSVRPL